MKSGGIHRGIQIPWKAFHMCGTRGEALLMTESNFHMQMEAALWKCCHSDNVHYWAHKTTHPSSPVRTLEGGVPQMTSNPYKPNIQQNIVALVSQWGNRHGRMNKLPKLTQLRSVSQSPHTQLLGQACSLEFPYLPGPMLLPEPPPLLPSATPGTAPAFYPLERSASSTMADQMPRLPC